MLYETAWLLRKVRALYGVDILEYLMCITFWASRPIELYQQALRYSVILDFNGSPLIYCGQFQGWFPTVVPWYPWTESVKRGYTVLRI